MVTQDQADAAFKWMRTEIDKEVPRMFRGYITDQMIWVLAVGALEAAEKAKKK